VIGNATYRRWKSLDYHPVIAAHDPDSLISDLAPHARVLEIGCHDGTVSCRLAAARPDISVTGIDINAAAIDGARARASAGWIVNARFDVRDAVAEPLGKTFDAIVTIRLLTCFPHAREWRLLVRTIGNLLAGGGTWLVIDYLYEPTNGAYRSRYAAAEEARWRRGNFQVQSPEGEPLFVAHHHTNEELLFLMRRFSVMRFRRFQSLSMHGNPACMFEMAAVKQAIQ